MNFTCLNCFQDFVGLIEMIGEALTGVVNDDPYLLALNIAEFERALSSVSHRVGLRLCIYPWYLYLVFLDKYRIT